MEIKARIPGKILDIQMREGEHADAGATAVILEAMKMENPIMVPVPCTITKIFVRPDDKVRIGQVLLEINPDTFRHGK